MSVLEFIYNNQWIGLAEPVPRTLEPIENRADKARLALDEMAIQFVCGHRDLSTLGVIDFLKNSNGKVKEDLERIVTDFLPLRRAQLQHLGKMSQTLGIPLSPVGIMTFSSGRIYDALDRLDSSTDDSIDGMYLHAKDFKSGPASKTGFWIINSAAASQENQDRNNQRNKHLGKTKIKLPPPERLGKFFPPGKKDVRAIHDTAEHEGFHSIHNALNKTVFEQDSTGNTILTEGLAFRTSILNGAETTESIKQLIMGSYLTNRQKTAKTKDQLKLFLNIISRSLSPDYQQKITWRGILSGSLEEFIYPSDELLKVAARLAEYSANLLPAIHRELGID